MEFRQLQTFVTITHAESFSRAAELLGYSQSAVTVQIRLLEEELQVRLFDRMGKKTVLTAQGRQLLEYANRIIQEVNQAKSAIVQDTELSEPLHVGTLESLCFSKLPPLLGYFRSNYPKVPVKVTTATPKELIAMMEKNQLDLIYFLDRPRYNNNWNKELEVREPIVFVTSPESPLASRKGLRLVEILDEPFFLTEKNENYRRELDQYLESRDRVITPFLEASNTEFIIQMIRRNRGVSFLPYFAVQESVRAGQLAVLDVTDFGVAMYRQIFYHKNKWKTREMGEFIRLAKLDLT
ncbi:MAG TPA: LysR family transcriptional regulator [Candidatus Lachnoclostridium stercoripullorum]|uniref:LysR family transcriptional regulator n=1 Tax=Candidatus Lachnoclostridium stercoripullorum TaxID=2838635 RepID=A0A9D1W4J6_9FIRM|nr:LysR family transcriptional regulator [Candidatus Lachnoclostridium stercoripullorum]